MSCIRTFLTCTMVLGLIAAYGNGAEAKPKKAKPKAAAASGRLVDFVEAGGCRVKVSPDVVARMKEIAANGSVVWKGKCQGGLISGMGVLREEGTLISGGKARKIAHHWSGAAVRGMRSGKWTRESFAQLVDGPKYWANTATVVFVDGIAKGRATPLPVSGPDDYSPGFRRIVTEAQRNVEQAADGSHDETPPREMEPKLAVSSMLRPEALKSEAGAAEATGSSPSLAVGVSKVEAGEAKAGLVVFVDSRGCKLWTSESEARRRTRIASLGAVTWLGACKGGYISGAGTLHEEGEAALGGRLVKFAYFLSGRANKGISTGQWKRESFEKFGDDKKFTAGIATLEFVDGISVETPTPVAVTSWSQYSIGFSTRILAPALGEHSQSASTSDSQPIAMAGDSSVAKPVDPIVPPPKVMMPAPTPAPPAPPKTVAAFPAPPPPVTQPQVKPDASAPSPIAAAIQTTMPAPVPAAVPATVPAPSPTTAPLQAKGAASAPAAPSIFSFSALSSALSSLLGPAPAPKSTAVTAPKSTPPPSPAPSPAPASKREPVNVVVKQITASSTHQSYGPAGLFEIKGPGWHAATPIVFPQELSFEFGAPVVIRRLALLHQEQHPERAPRGYLVEVSADGALWTLAAVVGDACGPNTSDGWNEAEFSRPTTARFMKLIITSNCGHPSLLTLRGVRLN
jgi:hypothetical protein